MRDWLGKPLIILAVILLLLAAISVCWLLSGPSPAAGEERMAGPPHQREVDRLVRQIENGR